LTYSNKNFDVIIIGSGIAGVSIGSELSNNLKICILEKENYLSYHSTGRSFAFYLESYGNKIIRQLTSASKDFFVNNSNNENPILKKRGVLHIGSKDQVSSIDALYSDLIQINDNFKLLDRNETIKLLPCLNSESIHNSIYDENASDIDVNNLYNVFLNECKKNNSVIEKNVLIQNCLKKGNHWILNTNKGEYNCNIIVNAAGAWAGEFGIKTGSQNINLIPKKRTIFGFKPLNVELNKNWPLAVDVEENFYFKIENDIVLASPADENPCKPHDAQPDEYDIAVGAERIKKSTLFQFNSIKNKWAGLRSFVKDKNPVIGFDNQIENFFWFAGQGGYGIQISPTLAKIANNIILKKDNNFYENKLGMNFKSFDVKRFIDE
tara:strand:+ start:7737 stop:8873 length:1137 start_codon:yes stop_codon:yes gene_type:complete